MKWQVLYADPPWHYQNWTKAKNGAASSAMETVPTEEMAKWDVGSLAEDNSLLFLWNCWPKLEDGLTLLDAWGFNFITAPFVWNKCYKSGKPYVGLGFWTRSGSEFVLLGKRGKGVPRAKDATNVRQVITAPVVRPHSTKPPEVRQAIDRLVGPKPSRLEIFARSNPDGLTLPFVCDWCEGKGCPECDATGERYRYPIKWHATGLELDGKRIEDFIEEQR